MNVQVNLEKEVCCLFKIRILTLVEHCKFVVLLTDVDCPLPPEFANSILVTWHSDSSSATAVYECNTGYQFSNGVTRKTYSCASYLWDEDFVDCTSTFTKIHCDWCPTQALARSYVLMTFNNLSSL